MNCYSKRLLHALLLKDVERNKKNVCGKGDGEGNYYYFFVMLNKMLLSTSGCSSLVHMFVLSCALQGQKGGDMTSFCSVDMGGLCGKTNDPKINLNRKKKKPMGQLVCYSSNHDATAGVYFYLLEGGDKRDEMDCCVEV